MFRKTIDVSVSFVSLLLGALIYVFHGGDTYISKIVSEVIGIAPMVRSPEFDIARYYFADYLWALSLACGLVFVLGEGKRNVITAVSLSVGLGFVWEILQFVGLVSGTGDVSDMIAYLFAGITAIVINAKELKK